MLKKFLIPILFTGTERLASVSWDEKQKREGLDEIASDVTVFQVCLSVKYFVTKLSLCVSDEGWRWQIAWSIGDLVVIVGGQRGGGSSFRFASVQCVQNRRLASVL